MKLYDVTLFAVFFVAVGLWPFVDDLYLNDAMLRTLFSYCTNESTMFEVTELDNLKAVVLVLVPHYSIIVFKLGKGRTDFTNILTHSFTKPWSILNLISVPCNSNVIKFKWNCFGAPNEISLIAQPTQ